MDETSGLRIGDVEVEESEAGIFYYVWNGFKWLDHREDGPSAVWHDGQEDYFLYGKKYSKHVFWAKKTKLGKILYG